MLVISPSGSNALARLDPKQACLSRALAIVRKHGQPSMTTEQAFRALLAWLKGELESGAVQADPSLAALFGRLSAGASVEQGVIAALRETRLGQRVLNRIQDLQDEVPFLFTLDADGLPVLRALSDLVDHEPVAFRFDESKAADLGGDEMTFTVAGSASASLGIAVISSARAQQRYGVGVSGCALALYADGALAGSAKVAQYGIGIGASGSAQRTLALLYQFDPAVTTVDALEHVLGDLPSSLSLSALTQTLDLPAQQGLRQFSLGGSTGFAFDLSAKAGMTRVDLRSVKLDGTAQEIRTTIDANLALQVHYDDQRKRSHRVSRRPDGDIVLDLERTQATTTTSALGIAAGITISGWDKVAARLIADTLPDASTLIEDLQEWAQPSAWIRNRLAGELPPALQDLAPILVGDVPDAGQALRELIGAAVDTRINLWDAVLEERTDVLVERLLDEVAGAISQRRVAEELRRWLDDRLTGVVAAARDDLLHSLQKKANVAAAGSSVLNRVGNGLSRIGRGVKKADAKAADLLNPAIAFLKDYSDFRARLLKQAETVLQGKLKLSIEHTTRQVATDRLEFELVVPAAVAAENGPAADADFRRWLNGQAFRDARHPFGVPVAHLQGDWKAASERLTEIGTALTLDLGFTGVSSKELLNASTRVEIGPGGVLLATTRTASSKSYAWSDEKVSALGRAMFNALASDTPLSQFTLDVEIADGRMTGEELRALLDSLRRPGLPALLSAATETEIRASWQRLRDAAGDAPAAKLRFGMVIDAAGRLRLREVARSPIALRTAIAEAMRIACSGRRDRDLALCLPTLRFDGDPVAEFVRGWDEFRRELAYGTIDYEDINGVRISRSATSASLEHPFGAATAIRRSIRPAHGMFTALQAVAAWPAFEELVAGEVLKLEADPAYTDVSVPEKAAKRARRAAEFYDRLGTGFAASFNRAIAGSDVLFDRSDDVPVNTLFVVILMARLTGAALEADLKANG